MQSHRAGVGRASAELFWRSCYATAEGESLGMHDAGITGDFPGVYHRAQTHNLSCSTKQVGKTCL